MIFKFNCCSKAFFLHISHSWVLSLVWILRWFPRFVFIDLNLLGVVFHLCVYRHLNSDHSFISSFTTRNLKYIYKWIKNLESLKYLVKLCYFDLFPWFIRLIISFCRWLSLSISFIDQKSNRNSLKRSFRYLIREKEVIRITIKQSKVRVGRTLRLKRNQVFIKTLMKNNTIDWG